MSNKTGIEILNTMIASDDLKLKKFIKLAEDFFVKNHLQNDPVGNLEIIYCHQIFNSIQKFCLDTICLEPKSYLTLLSLLIYLHL